MSDGTKIEWTDATANVVNGCSVVSPGCTNCYAMRLAGTRMKSHPTRAGLTQDSKAGPVWTGEVRFNEAALQQVLRWTAPRMIFWNAHGDPFHENVPDEWIDRCFAVMALTPQHKHQVLTKRPERMRAYFDRYDAAHDHNCADFVADAVARQLGREGAKGSERTTGTEFDWPLQNVWLGVSVEDQLRADERIPILLDTPAAVRWLSMEPLLGPVDLSMAPARGRAGWLSPLTGDHKLQPVHACHRGARIDWVVLGGESGPGARPMHPDWARSVRDQCATAGVPFLFKQWGNWLPYGSMDGDGHHNSRDRGEKPGAWHAWNDESGAVGSVLVGKRQAGRFLDGVQHDGFPA